MAITQSELTSLLQAAFPQGQIEVVDLAGDNRHYRAHVRDPGFAGKSRVAQHQAVYAALQGRMGGEGAGELHALALVTGVLQPEPGQT